MNPDDWRFIEFAATMAYAGRAGEAENWRARAGYAGLGVVDSGPTLHDSEASRQRFYEAFREFEKE